MARLVLFVFLLTFIAVRILVFLIMSERIPDLFIYVGGTHIHHLNFGIFLLAIIGGYLIFICPDQKVLKVMAVLYGIGLALTFDEFGMWLHLGGSYWQRSSFDAITVIAAVLALIAFAPPLRQWGAQHYFSSGLVLFIIGVFFCMLFFSLHIAETRLEYKMIGVEHPELDRSN